jgi:hypothetical protein
MSKRIRFIITSILLSLGFVGIQLLPDSYRFLSIGILSLLTVLFFIWSLWEGLGFDATLLTLILPFSFTTGVGLFWFLLPTSIFTRIPIVIFYGLGIYALCLTANIYTVATIRTIALLRAARGVGFVLSLLTMFLLFDTVLSLRVSIVITSLLVTFVSFLLFLQGFWTIPLEEKINLDVLKMSALSSLMMGEVAVSLFFWPVTVVVGSLFFTITSYSLLGLGQVWLEGRYFKQTIREYLTVSLLVAIGMFFATHWGS